MCGAARLEAIVRATPWLVRALTVARVLNPPDWLLGAVHLWYARRSGFHIEPLSSSADAVAPGPRRRPPSLCTSTPTTG